MPVGLRAALLGLVAVLTAGGCSWTAGPGVPADAERIGMVNATTHPVAVTVNGAWIGTYPSWSQQQELAIHGHGGPPWKVAFQTPAGEEIAELTIDDDAGHSSSSTSFVSPCGEFHAWSGPAPADVPVVDGTTPPPPDARCR